MKKVILILGLLLVFTSCKNEPTSVEEDMEEVTLSQEGNSE